MSCSGVKHMLQSDFYTGSYTYGGKKYNGNHPALITEKEREQVLELIGGKHNNRPRSDYLPFVTRGMIKCATCGYAIVAETKHKKLKDGTIKDYTYCHCSGKCKKFKCPQAKIYVREEDIIKQIKDILSRYTISKEYFDLAIQALAEEEDRRFSDQKTTIENIRNQIDRKKTALNGLRRMRYMGECPDDEFFNSESNNLENEIEALNKRINVIESAAKDWRQIANDVFAFARYAKEDFDSDDLERKQYVMSAMGTNLQLSGRTLTFTPVKYLIPIEKAMAEIAPVSESARTNVQQMKKVPKDLKFHLGAGSRTRTYEARRREIYSLLSLPLDDSSNKFIIHYNNSKINENTGEILLNFSLPNSHSRFRCRLCCLSCF